MKDADLTNTTIISDNLSDRINEIKQQGDKDILLFGSPTATHSLIQLNLIDGYWLFVNPIILGRGIPLFADIQDKIKLNLVTTRQFTCGVTFFRPPGVLPHSQYNIIECSGQTPGLVAIVYSSIFLMLVYSDQLPVRQQF